MYAICMQVERLTYKYLVVDGSPVLSGCEEMHGIQIGYVDSACVRGRSIVIIFLKIDVMESILYTTFRRR